MKTATHTPCPTCSAPTLMTWSGLDLVAETGDETLASKHYHFDEGLLDEMTLALQGMCDFYNSIDKIQITQLDIEVYEKAKSVLNKIYP